MLAMVPTLARSAHRLRREGRWGEQIQYVRQRYREGGIKLLLREQDEDLLDPNDPSHSSPDNEEQESFLKPSDHDPLSSSADNLPPSRAANAHT